MDDNRNKIFCPNCSQLFLLKLTTPLKGNIPLFLSCGHSMCESCIRNIVKFDEPIECKICHRDMKVAVSDIALLALNNSRLYEIFPINVQILGELMSQRIEQSHVSGKKKDENHFINLQAILNSTDTTQGECMECHIQTSKMCKQCATILCDACFNKSHKNFTIFQNHVLHNIEPVMGSNNCKQHKGNPLNYYCKDCCKSICMACMMLSGEKSCKNHNMVSLDEVEETFIEELVDLGPKVDETFRRLTKTGCDIGHLLLNIENDTGTSSELTNMLASIKQHFSKLSFTLLKHEKEVIDIIIKLKCSEKESLLKAKKEVTNAIKKAKTTINKINVVLDPKKAREINLPDLLKDAKSVVETPWYLSKDESKDPLKMTVNEDLCSLMSDYIQLDGNANSVYKLRPVAELPDSVELPPPPTGPVFPPELPKDVRVMEPKKPPVLFREVPKYRPKSGSVSSHNSADSDNSQRTSQLAYGAKFQSGYGGEYQRPMVHPVQPVHPFSESQHPKQLREGSQELIYISHIVDPHNFFVQRSCHQSMVKEMLREFRNAGSLPKPSVNHVAEGKTYLVFNQADNMWQRCRVVSIDRRNENKPMFEVFCIDFGSTEVVDIDKLRLLPPARVNSPFPLAINCSLANCKPKTGTWSSDDSYLIQNIIDNKQAVIHVRQIWAASSCAMVLEVDLTTFHDGVSLAHALVFHERATMPNPKLPYPRILGNMDRPKLFTNNNDYRPQSTEEVYLTHILSPDKFYVRKHHLQTVYEKLCEDLDQEYSLTINTGSVFLPAVGMVCVVNVEKYREAVGETGGAWERALVLELPGRGRARLLLPDTGAQLVAHWTALRHIYHKFTTLTHLATECHLSGVTPLNKKWSQGSVALMRRFEDQLLELHVEEQRRGSVGVTLSHRTDHEDVVCLNTEMIKHKFAITFGLFMFNKNFIVEDQVHTNKSPLDEPQRSKPKRGEVKVLKRSQSPKEEVKKQLDFIDKGPLRLEATLLHYQSPSLFYVSLVHQQKVFSELYENMQKHYSSKKTQGKTDWNVEDRCCTLCNQSQTWRRALIVELEGENAKVFYSDFACIETVPVSSLRELTPEFTSIGDAAIKCHLCGVVPADGTEWPSITKEYLKELLDAYRRVFITKLGNFKEKSMPVELWVYHTIQGAALEPNISEWRCLNKKVIEQGLGVPDKTQPGLSTDASDNVEDDMIMFLKNVTGSVQDYLQLEPMPTKPLVVAPAPETPESDLQTPEEYEDTQAGTSNTVFISDWLPAEPLPSKEFTGMPTFVDNDGVVYLHDVVQQETLQLIRRALDVRFKSPDPKAKYTKWHVGEPCVALFQLDNRFYRGRIMEVNNESAKCIVHYIDYGNDEVCSFESLRKSIALHQIPTQAHRCVLSRIRPAGGRWTRHTLDYIHQSIVEKNCFVRVVGEPIGGIIPIELKYNIMWINDHLVDFEMAVYTDGSKAAISKFVPNKVKCEEHAVEPVIVESDSEPDFIVDNDTSLDMKYLDGKDWNELLDEDDGQSLDGLQLTYPKNDAEEFICNISIINTLKTVELSIVHNDETNVIYEQMFEEIQREGENMSPLNGVLKDKACIALFHEDGLWYRASILQYNESECKIKVRYVDYGNIAIVSLADVREIDKEWTRLPPGTVSAVLHGFQVNPSLDVNHVSQEFAKTYLDKGPFRAKVIGHDESLPSVELRDDDGELVYKKLIEDEVLLKSMPDLVG